MPTNQRPAVLFLCTGNSCRSQMAEGWTRALLGDRYDVDSAGLEAHGLNPHAVAVMAEAGVDIRAQRSLRLDEIDVGRFDLIVTVCGHADERCPSLPPTVRKIHVPFDDPPKLAKDAASEEEALDCYRRVRDEIRALAEKVPSLLESGPRAPSE